MMSDTYRGAEWEEEIVDEELTRFELFYGVGRVSDDLLQYAVYLRHGIKDRHEMLDMLHRGAFSVEYNSSDPAKSVVALVDEDLL